MSTTLYQRAKTGKVKYTTFWTDGPRFYRKWGTLCSDKPQTTFKECKAKNVGRANATTAAEQAYAEMEAKITKKKKEGMVERQEDLREEAVVEISLDNLPSSFCPSKPRTTAPADVLGCSNTYGQRKRDGHCIIVVKTETGVGKIFSRRMEDITPHVARIPEVSVLLGKVPRGSMIFTEFCFVLSSGNDSPRHVASLIRTKDIKKVADKYNNFKKQGRFEIVPFDLMYVRDPECPPTFCKTMFVGDQTYSDRHQILTQIFEDTQFNVPEIHHDWKTLIAQAKEDGWEGFILRNDDVGSNICYTLNGKADRAGCWKYVFVQEDDVVVTSATKGTAGRLRGFYAHFEIEQYQKDGTVINAGKCGPGKQDHDEIVDLTREIDSGELKFPFTIQVEYRDRESDSGKLKFAQFVRVRYDKKPSECITDFELE